MPLKKCQVNDHLLGRSINGRRSYIAPKYHHNSRSLIKQGRVGANGLGYHCTAPEPIIFFIFFLPSL